MRAVIPRRAALRPVPALPLGAGFQGGAAPLGVSLRTAAKDRSTALMSLGNSPLQRGLQSAIRARLSILFRA